MKKFLLMFGLLAIYKPAYSAAQAVTIAPVVTASSATASGGSAAVIISSPTGNTGPYSGGLYNYITNVHVEMYAAGTLTGGATPVNCTFTGFSNNPVLKFQTAEATGTEQVTDMQFANPLQGNQGGQVSLSCPGTASVIWNIVVGYFSGQ